jgi:hypothetical protein
VIWGLETRIKAPILLIIFQLPPKTQEAENIKWKVAAEEHHVSMTLSTKKTVEKIREFYLCIVVSLHTYICHNYIHVEPIPQNYMCKGSCKV